MKKSKIEMTAECAAGGDGSRRRGPDQTAVPDLRLFISGTKPLDSILMVRTRPDDDLSLVRVQPQGQAREVT